MWRFCASLPLFPSLCTPGLRVNDPCLPTSKGHGPMAFIVQPPFGQFLNDFLLTIYDSMFAFLSTRFTIHFQEALWKYQPELIDIRLSSQTNARAYRLMSVSRILSLHSCIVLAYSRHIGAFCDLWNIQTFKTIFFSYIWLLQNFGCFEIMPCNWGSPFKNIEVLLTYFNSLHETHNTDLPHMLWTPSVIEIFENDTTWSLCCNKVQFVVATATGFKEAVSP
jgi:hypothetical protein